MRSGQGRGNSGRGELGYRLGRLWSAAEVRRVPLRTIIVAIVAVAFFFLAAGGDLVTSQSLGPAEQMAASVLARASGDAAFRATVEAAAARVLAAKQAAGLLPCS